MADEKGGIERRRFFRHPSNIPIQVRLADGTVEGPSELKDVSLGGVAFKVREELQPGCHITIRITLVQPEFESQGRVVWCRKTGDFFSVGMEFVVAADVFKARMVEQICHIEDYRRDLAENHNRHLTSEEAAKEWIQKFASQFPNPGI